MQKLLVDGSCINCDACSNACPAMNGEAGPAILRGRPVRINPAVCIECGFCVTACPFSFITKVQISPPEGLGALQELPVEAGGVPDEVSSAAPASTTPPSVALFYETITPAPVVPTSFKRRNRKTRPSA